MGIRAVLAGNVANHPCYSIFECSMVLDMSWDAPERPVGMRTCSDVQGVGLRCLDGLILETQCMFPFSYTEQALPLATWHSLDSL